jgi:hypothetical protein
MGSGAANLVVQVRELDDATLKFVPKGFGATSLVEAGPTSAAGCVPVGVPGVAGSADGVEVVVIHGRQRSHVRCCPHLDARKSLQVARLALSATAPASSPCSDARVTRKEWVQCKMPALLRTRDGDDPRPLARRRRSA